MRIELELLADGNMVVDLGSLPPSKILSMTIREIEKSCVQVDSRQSEVGEHFKLKQTTVPVDEVVLSGPTGRIISAGRQMEAGRLVIEGDAGPRTGAEMSGGELEVSGNAGDCLGTAMHGGWLRVRGNAGDWCGAAQPGQIIGMSGGTLIVEGDTGIETGSGMRRGLLVIGGDSGEYTGVRMQAGTILCIGRLGRAAGLEMKRGSLVAGSSGKIIPGFRLAGEADPEWLRIYLTCLRRHGLTTPRTWEERPLKRFSGDHLVTGKGEIMVHDILE